jgi:hypothetical protein
MKELIVKDIIGTPSAISQRSGEVIYKILSKYITRKETVELSFKDIEDCITTFCNSSIGKLYMNLPPRQVSRYLKIKDCNDIWKLKIENSKKLGINSNLRSVHQNSLSELFYS